MCSSDLSETYDQMMDDFEAYLGKEGDLHCADSGLFLGEVLCLLSLVEGGLNNRNEENLYGYGDITEDILESLSSHLASEYYLVYNVNDVAKEHGLVLPDFAAAKASIKDDFAKYSEAFGGAENDSVKRAAEWKDKAMKRIDELENNLLNVFDIAMSPLRKEDGSLDFGKPVCAVVRVKDEIKDIERELSTRLDVGPTVQLGLRR